MPLESGQVLNNRYRIVRLLGQGGFGAVYRAWDTNLNRPCAVKENLDTSPEAQRQFTREATVLANLSHPNLPRVTDHFILPGKGQYLVMDFVEGDDLASMLSRQVTLPAEKVLTWIGQVADALGYLHERQPPVVHRDVKPANIRVTPDGQAMLVDFGLVKVYNPNLRTTLGARAVTPGYAPPEQYGQGHTDGRTDLYALAATSYNLLTGKDPMESVQRMAGGQMPLAHQVNPQIPAYISMAIERAMRLEPDQRFRTVAEFKAALAMPAPPSVVVRPASDVYGRQSPVIPPTQVAPAMAPQPARVAQAPAAAGGRPVSRPTAARRRGSSGMWIGVAVVLSLCLVGVVVGSLLIASDQQRAAQQTADAQYQITLAERVRLTSTGQAQATQTADLAVSATRGAAATQQARSDFLSFVDANRVLVYGPAQDRLPHEPADQLIEAKDAGVNLRDFVVQARFFNPYNADKGAWDYGFVLRHAAKNEHFRFVISSDRKWELTNHNGDPDGEIVAEGVLDNLDLSENGSNQVQLIFHGERGLFYLNDVFIAEFNLSARLNPGAVFITTGNRQGHEIDGYSTNYTDFSIWSLP